MALWDYNTPFSVVLNIYRVWYGFCICIAILLKMEAAILIMEFILILRYESGYIVARFLSKNFYFERKWTKIISNYPEK